jgi:hypothetical protein
MNKKERATPVWAYAKCGLWPQADVAKRCGCAPNSHFFCSGQFIGTSMLDCALSLYGQAPVAGGFSVSNH